MIVSFLLQCLLAFTCIESFAASGPLYQEAKEAFYNAQLNESLRTVKAAIDADPAYGPALALSARIRHINGEISKERDEANRALSLFENEVNDADYLASKSSIYLSLNQIDEALSASQQALSASNNSALAYEARGRVYMQMGSWTKAISDFDNAISLKSSSPLLLYLRANARYQNGEFQKATEDLTAALNLNKNFAMAFGLLGASLAKIGDPDRAMKAYSLALNLDPQYTFAYLGLAAIYLGQKNDETAALQQYAKAIENNPEDYSTYVNRAHYYWQKNQRDDAIADEKKALKAANLTSKAALDIGNRFLSNHLWRDAVEAFTRARENPAEAIVGRARAWRALNEPDKALADLNEGIRLVPDNAELLASRADLLAQLGRLKEADTDFSQALKLGPRSYWVYLLRAVYFAKQQKTQAALQNFETAISLNPKSAQAYFGLGLLRAYYSDDWEKGLYNIQKAVDLEPNEPNYLIGLAQMHLKYRMYLKALEDLDRAQALGGKMSNILSARSEVKFQMGDQVGASQDIQNAIASEPDNIEFIDALGSMYLRRNEYEAAIKQFQHALEKDNRAGFVYTHLGYAYGSNNDLKSAAENFKRATKFDPESKEAWTGLCLTKRLLGDIRGAAKDCDQAIETDARYGPAHTQRGLVAYSQRNYAQAVEEFNSAWLLGERRAEAQLAKALAFASLSQYKIAHKTYLLAISLDPYVRSFSVGFTTNHPEGDDFSQVVADMSNKLVKDRNDLYSMIFMADGLLNSEHPKDAMQILDRVIEVDPSIADAHNARGLALVALKNYGDAQKSFVQATSVDATDPDPMINLAIVLTQRREFEAAINTLLKVIQLDPKRAELYVRAGNVRYFMKDFQKALENYTLAARVDSLDPTARNGIGLASSAMGRYDEAIQNFSRAIALNPFVERFYRNRATVWKAKNNYQNASIDYQTASLVNTNPTKIEEYRRLIKEMETLIKGNSH